MANLSLRSLQKVYDKKYVAVKDFNLEIADKEFIVLVGPSGCGKSTTLRMIAGLEEITSGELEIDGIRVNNVAPKDRDIAMVFQNYALYPHMTVFDNMAFALKMKKVPKAEIKERVHQAAEILDITDYLNRKPRSLSGGQRQRVAIGRAIVRNPKVFLMDEPLSNLDAKLRNQMRAEIKKIHQRINTTFVYVTHDQTEAMTLGSRIVIMQDGIVQQIGAPQEVFNAPANLFVAGFIGSPQMNFFDDCRLICEKGEYALVVRGIKQLIGQKIQTALRAKGVEARDVTVGIRPEHIEVVNPDGDNALSAAVDVVEMMGSEVHFHLMMDNKQKIVLKMQTSYEGNNIQATPELYFKLAEDQIHLFDKDTGHNILSEERCHEHD